MSHVESKIGGRAPARTKMGTMSHGPHPLRSFSCHIKRKKVPLHKKIFHEGELAAEEVDAMILSILCTVSLESCSGDLKAWLLGSFRSCILM
jgi:hypothetical protein